MTRNNIDKLREIMATLRDPDTGCPWDQAQDFASIVPHTLEEAYEVAEAIEAGAMDELCDELGDLLFQVIFYARLAEEQGLFDFEQVAAGIVEKLIRRHPHVFAGATISTTEAQTRAWEASKARERAEKAEGGGALTGVATALPAMTRAVKLQKRAARVGFDWPDIAPVFAKVQEELEELRAEAAVAHNTARIEEEMGDLLFACANLARHAHVEPETALRHANRKFERRFAQMEVMAKAQGRDVSELGLDAWELLWESVKAGESE
ncbi:MAG TPA: nucleoside triphosphate pyrophosphohydrolase [Gammaproteobacteria bacterium]|nr:nucleoside triphosphate pyrophosphohydrolase [Gammaproteobacteria bacterium]